MELNDEIQFIKDIIDRRLDEVLSNRTGYQNRIVESINYSLFTGGKRLRPILLLKSCQMLCGDYDNAIQFALAIEMIHTYSLIHDDLPSMDDDDFRRGKPTNHKVYGEAMAILSGDGLLNLAFETMLDYTLKNSKTIKDFRNRVRAIYEIAKYSGIEGMVGGQVVDVLSNEIEMDEAKLKFVYESKTAALIQASVVAGAILGGGKEEDIKKIREFGLYIGIAYQIKDDILDKKEDELIDKITYLTFNTAKDARDRIEELKKKVDSILDSYNNMESAFIKKFVEILLDIGD